MTDQFQFKDIFNTLTGNKPFPWQIELYQRFRNGKCVRSLDIPTGLGKTSVIAIWLIALANHPEKMARRLVYVVNRRTVVDQTTNEVEKIRRNLLEKPKLKVLRECLGPLALSTLRGQFADNREWSADPSCLAVICGTVDMIGSRLLFSGYRIGFKSKPLHAAFLGQDALLVHDEAHLEPAFQELIEAIEREQQREATCRVGEKITWPTLRVMALSATARSADAGEEGSLDNTVLRLSSEDHKHPDVKQRIEATKKLVLHEIGCHVSGGKERKSSDIEKDWISRILENVKSFQDSNSTVLVFVRRVEDVEKIVKELPKGATAQLTGTLRGLERDNLVQSSVFNRFLPMSDREATAELPEGTVYLVCTSAGEVGVNVSADHLVCDLSTFDSMAQRFGRVNRFGDRDDTQIHVVHPTSFGKKDKSGKVKISELDERRQRTLDLLKQLAGDASPHALGQLDAEARRTAFAPEPTFLPTSDILFDAWSLTTIRDKMPGRPPVEPYLHGITEWEPPQTLIAWRDEVEEISGDLLTRYQPKDLLEDFPLKPHELLQDRSDRVFKALGEIAKQFPDSPAWVISNDGSVVVASIKDLADKNDKGRINRQTVLLPPAVGGLSGGLLDGKVQHAASVDYDVADFLFDVKGRNRRVRIWDDTEPPQGMALIRRIDTRPNSEEFESDNVASLNGTRTRRFWHWYIRPRDAEDVTRASTQPIRLEHHTGDVVTRIRQFISSVRLDRELQEVLVFAAELHDLGKRRELFQRSIGNPNSTDGNWYAKPGKPKGEPRWRPRRISTYRHEYGSLLDILDPNQEYRSRFLQLSDSMQELVLHVIAAHHGRARPHFPSVEAFDPAPGSADRASAQMLETPLRFARLQREYGRWGLAYLESLLRAADWAASAEPSPLGKSVEKENL